MAEFVGLEEANRAALANMSPRYQRLQELGKWAEGTQYQGRPDWWTGGPKEVPVWEREPCVVYPAVAIAIQSNVDLVLGEGRFPSISSRPQEDESEESKANESDDSENGLGEDDSEQLDRFIREYHKITCFKAHCREAFADAQANKTAVAIHGHRAGKPFNDLIPAKWANPKLAVDGSVEELEIRYPYFEETQAQGKWHVKAKLYRRVINALTDITFAPADAREDGTEPNWVAQSTITHGLGFCPVIWYPFMRGCAPVNVIDGKAIHELVKTEIQDHDIALSQKHRCALLSEPQPVEIGVSQGYNPTGELGREAIVPSTERGGALPGSPEWTGGDPGKATGGYNRETGSAKQARKKGPSYMWSYTNPQTKVEYLCFPDSVLTRMAEHCSDLLEKIEAALGVVFPKANQFKFAGSVSGKSLEQTKSRQFDRCDQYRDDLQEKFIIPSVNMQLRVAQKAREQLRVPGIKRVLSILDRFETPNVAAPVANA